MIKKEFERKNAIKLRKQGLTYQEILNKIPVAKSTLSLWLRDVGLAKKQKQILSQKKILSAKRGGIAKKNQRIEKFNTIVNNASKDIGTLSDKELFLIGTTLYWAEGAKEKPDRPGSGFQFGNMDPRMVQVVLAWLERVCKIQKSMVVYELYIHKSHKNRLSEMVKYWENTLGLNRGSITKVYLKNNQSSNTNRKNTGSEYRGLIRIRVNQSSTLVREIAGWVNGIYKEICE